MKSIITNAADITVLRLIADGTSKTGGGPVSIGATVIMASKGPVGKIVKVAADTWKAIFGKPLNKKAVGMEGLRHLADAAKDCTYVNAVRVVDAAARFPSLTLQAITAYKGSWLTLTDYEVGDVVDVVDGKLICMIAHESAAAPSVAVSGANWDPYVPFVAGAHAYGTALSNVDDIFQVWPIDGDPSLNRSLEVANVVNDKGAYNTLSTYAVNDVVTVAGGRLICVAPHIATDADPTMAAPTNRWKVYNGQHDNVFTLNFYDVDDEGTKYLLETYQVSLNPEAKDDIGRSAFLETVLEQQSTRFNGNAKEGTATLTAAEVAALAMGSTETAFTGGTNGGEPSTEEWKAAWDLFRNESVLANLMFAAGNTDADVLSNCIDIADQRHVSFFFDISPALPPAQALVWLKGTGLEGRQAAVYHSPFEASDPYYGGKCVWGVSGEAAAACAKGDANFTGGTAGIHYAPAGSLRARLSRTGIKPLYPNEVMNRDDYYDARVNPVVAGESGGAVIDDCLSLWYRQDYRRFIWVNRIANYIDHRFVEGAAAIKFEPDGITRKGLGKVITQILDELVISGALVKPRDPADGTSPYVYSITQQEIDLWLVDWAICPTGAARRIAGQPRLIK